MTKSIRISQTDFRRGNDSYRGVQIEPGLWIGYAPEDSGDFLTSGEVAELRDWLNEHYPADTGEPTEAQVERVAKAIFMTDYMHMGEDAWDTARFDGNNDRRAAFEKARAAIAAGVGSVQVDEDALAEAITRAENDWQRDVGGTTQRHYAIARAVAEWLKEQGGESCGE